MPPPPGGASPPTRGPSSVGRELWFVVYQELSDRAEVHSWQSPSRSRRQKQEGILYPGHPLVSTEMVMTNKDWRRGPWWGWPGTHGTVCSRGSGPAAGFFQVTTGANCS